MAPPARWPRRDHRASTFGWNFIAAEGSLDRQKQPETRDSGSSSEAQHRQQIGPRPGIQAFDDAAPAITAAESVEPQRFLDVWVELHSSLRELHSSSSRHKQPETRESGPRSEAQHRHQISSRPGIRASGGRADGAASAMAAAVIIEPQHSDGTSSPSAFPRRLGGTSLPRKISSPCVDR